ncbi:MAG TPA: type II toxin-antitoxin system RelE/ParE family toxin [Burkholderiaceae bacterium]|nr:type II toxin-antitoxin system RelE/ParE family toxin [Burkholderiaceae bacterium]HNG79642.1 type II toxin-antitoxin system RelE/ParE family toxin [Burkholderiaceae bacterium]
MNYFFHEAARIEHLEHVAYYEAQRRGLGARYLAAFDAAMAMVCENPGRYRVELPPGIRRCRVPGFPYNVLYRVSGADVEVLVVAPHRRRPGYWIDRL